VDGSFSSALSANGMTLAKVVTVRKPEDQTTYADQLTQLKAANVQIFVPAQDPITTSREVAECRVQLCPWKYSAVNFAHDLDKALKLMQGSWDGARILGGACTNEPGNDAKNCGALRAAHEQWLAYNDEADWQSTGQDGKAGYQLVHYWLKALKDTGADLTRERFRAALNTYSNYSDLITSPITYHPGAKGAGLVVPYRATNEAGGVYKQMSPGFVGY
jgi:hypothetical protein